MVQTERTPQTLLRKEQSTLQKRNDAYGGLKNQLTSLQTAVDALKDTNLYNSTTVSSSDSSVATATTANGAAKGTYAFAVTQMATTASYQGKNNISKALTTDASTLIAVNGKYGAALTTGYFTVNNQQIQVTSTSTLQNVLDSVKAALGTGGSATYDRVNDKIVLSSSSNIVLGSTGDTSNFLQAARLDNNAADPKNVSSSFAIAAVDLNAKLNTTNLAFAVTNTDAKTFQINGVSISYNAANDSLSDVLGRINSSNAGVTASYDTFNDKIVLANKTTGNLGVSLGGDTGNFLSAMNLTSSQPDISQPLTTDPATLVAVNGKYSAALTVGTFTVNSQQIQVTLSSTLKDILDGIKTALGPGSSASYDSLTDKITLSSSSSIILGDSGDTSNFLQVARLSNNPVDPKNVTSTYSIAALDMNAKLNASNLIGIVDNTDTKAFKINGVSIDYNAADDSMTDVVNRINNSAAGVNASYDSINDRIVLANKNGGTSGITVGEDTGNFLTATKLTTGTLQAGQDLQYSVNGGPTLYSHSNTIDEKSSGIAKLTVNVLKAGTVGAPQTTTVEVRDDTTKVKQAITDFIAEYNKTQSLIDAQTASTTDSSGKVTAGTLASEQDANEIATQLRNKVFAAISGLSGSINQLSQIGIQTNGYDNSLTLSNGATLDSLLTNNPNQIRDLFSDSTNGLAVNLSTYLDQVAGEDGSLAKKQTNLSNLSVSIDSQITDMERIVQMNKDRLTASFVAMETAKAKTDQQATFLSQQKWS